ncbi:histone-fold-containing protein [Mollisia scopiformis]|uniref:Histone-fold-containing protein n=1 Tax=Mollisia scopiformis TaxID=149040 RepID=A0A194XPU2_MOLSC|nr:histone-fold-containing protein [Mollisia scopiformis]KUJ22275.1 histone-fold-containing protein [Mollisia scopiformis]
MSASPPKETEHEGVQSPDDPDAQMNQDPHSSGLAYEFEVKEQDRWLPIANDILRILKLAVTGTASRTCIECSRMFLNWPVIELGAQTLQVCCVTAIICPIMSHSSSSPSPQAPSSTSKTSKGSKDDYLDSNIRNFAPVARIMKTALPENAKIAKEAKECMQECVSEFISFITSEASEKCHQEKRKTVNGEDILFAMTSLGFENYAEALKIYLSKYRETQSTRGENRPGSQGFGSAAAGGSGGAANATSSTTFAGGPEGTNNILGGQPGEGADHDGGSYGNIYGGQVSSGHNGATGGEGY